MQFQADTQFANDHDFAGDNTRRSTDTTAPATGDGLNDPTGNEEVFVVPPFFLTKKANDTTVKTTARNARVAWTASRNKLIDDAVQRAIRECPGKRVVRVQPWSVEMRNLKRVGEDVESTPTDTSTHANADLGLLTLVEHHDKQRQIAFSSKSPTQVHGSLSEYARSKAIDDPDTWVRVHAAWNQKLMDPECYELNRPHHQEAFRTLMSAAIADVDIACETPVALLDFANHDSWTPDAIVFDEAARATETSTLMLASRWQEALALYIGNTKQFQPMALATDQEDFVSVFAQQRAVSLFQRMESTGRLTCVMK
ncbi:hypothetical protein FHETE_4156 [Fusarium heterosporum]|uniref:DNA2/NAM7 helicase helicase domain-containing protein n=1 Tax=Fusarium heterosporum TaxID=42747 RepID=A0A8H5TFP2_FUSHE|nr:hypothetical protein FHETE_4156 [Fusarium heterosporum]